MTSGVAQTEGIVNAIEPRPILIPADLQISLAPATHYLLEWRDYYLSWPGATRLWVGNDWKEPVAPGVFRVMFENQLGLTSLQPFQEGRPLAAPLRLEVISPKFPDPATHYDFFRTLLDDLFARAARLRFHFIGPTSRGVGESLQPPSALFVYHFLLHHGPQLRQALETLRAWPHRLLVDHPTYLPVGQVSEVDPTVLMDIMHSPHRWAPAREFRLAERLNGFAPTHVWQQLSEETLDTPENRFVLAFLRQLFTAAETLPAQSWRRMIPEGRAQVVTELTGLVSHTLALSMFREVGVMERVPLNPQVLLRAVQSYRRKDGLARFIILDEMNLARVEYYFADLLSVLESGRDADGWTREPMRLVYPDNAEGELPPVEVYLPPNLYVIGTVDVDETTHAFSPKVLDRAFTLELTEADFNAYPSGQSVSTSKLGDRERKSLLDGFSFGGRCAQVDKAAIAALVNSRPEVRARLQTLNAQLRRYDLHFGYRVFDEIISFLISAGGNRTFEQMSGFDAAFDAAVLMKVLPKFHGSRGRLEAPLKALLAWCVDPDAPAEDQISTALQNVQSDTVRATLANLSYRYPKTAECAGRMLWALYTDGFAAFG